MSVYKPVGFLLVQDPLFDGNMVTGSYGGVPPLVPQAGPHAGPSAAETTNLGSMVPFSHGKWDETNTTEFYQPKNIKYRVLHAGGMYGNAEWGWRLQGETDANFRGMNDIRDFTNIHQPWNLGASVANSEMMMLCAIHSRAYNRVLLFRYTTSGNDRFEIAYRSCADQSPEAWSTVNFPTATGFGGYKNFDPARMPRPTTVPYACGWENPDGTLRFLYPYNPPDAGSTLKYEFDIWGSSDGGMTWEVVSEQICMKYAGGYRTLKFINADSSGDWIRISMYVADTSPYGLVTMVSSDGGASWKLLSNTPDGNDTYSADSWAQYEVSGICGLGTAEGSFLRVRYQGSDTLRYEVATRDSDWTEITTSALLYDTVESPRAVYVGRGAAYAHVLVIGADPDSAGEEVCGYDGRTSYVIPLNAVMDPRLTTGEGAWIARGQATDGNPSTGSVERSGFMNQHYTAYRPKLGSNAYRWAGDGMILCHAVYSHKSTSTVYDSSGGIDGLCAVYNMSWSQRPLRSRLWNTENDTTNAYWIPYYTAAGAALANHESANQWRVEWGGPNSNAAGVTTGTAWSVASSFWAGVATNFAHVTNDWQVDQYKMTSGTAFNDAYYLDRSFTVTPSPPDGYGLGDRSVFQWVMKIDATSTAALPAIANADQPAIGAFVGDVNTLGTAGTFQVSVALTTTEAAVYDCVAGTTLYHATGKDFTKWTKFRLAMGHSEFVGDDGNDVWANFSFYHPADGSAAWTSSGLVELDNSSLSPVGYQWLQLGMGLGGANAPGTTSGSGTGGSTIYLRNIIITRGEELGNLYYDNPWTVRGCPASTYQRHITQGIYGTWGGGAGFKGDSFTMDVDYEYGAEKIIQPGTSVTWRSLSATSLTEMVFDAQSNQTKNRFSHHGAALIGTNIRIARIDYDDNIAFSSPAGMTLDATIYGVQVGVAPTSAFTDGFTVTASQDVWKDHELSGMYAEWYTGGAALQIFKIRDNIGRHIYFTGLTQAVHNYGVSSGDTFWIYDKKSMGVLSSTESANAHGARYMRIRVPAGRPQEGYWYLGNLVAGSTVQLSVPLDWDHSESQVGNVDVQTVLNGTRISYLAGPSRKTITGTALGDADNTRELYRATINKIADYSHRPMVLVPDDDSLNTSMFYCRFTGQVEMENPGWKYDSTLGRWITVGDMGVAFEEEL